MTAEDKRAQLVALKKQSVVELLDTAVAVHGLSTEDYLQLKVDLLERIDQDAAHATGLFQWLEMANTLAAQCLGDPALKIAVGAEIREEILQQKPEKPRKVKADAALAAANPKAILLKQLELMPPWLNARELEHYRSLIQRLPLGAFTEGLELKTTGDAEYELVRKARERFERKVDQLVAKAPELFLDKLERPDGSVKRVNVEKNLRKQMARMSTMRQFLSFKDLVARYVSEYKRERLKKKSLLDKIRFW